MILIYFIFSQFRYNQVALSHESYQETMSHHETYPAKEAFFVECHNPQRTLKCRVSVECDGGEITSMLVTPYTPIKGAILNIIQCSATIIIYVTMATIKF